MSIKRIGSIKDYTPNFKIIIPRFDLATWHDYIEENFRNIDALFFNLFGINNYSGSWKQITEYKQGQVLFIGDDLDINGNVTDFSGRLVKVLVDHTTDNSDYFNIFYNLYPDYYELFADASTAQVYAQQAQSYKNETEILKNDTNIIKEETNSIKNDADLIKSDVIIKQNEINDTISSFNEDFSTKTEEITQQIEDGKVIIAQETAISTENVEKSRIWAEGEQAEVETLGGTLSSRGHADLAMAIANADEDVPIDASGLIALNVIKGPKGDKGDPGKDFYDGYVTNCITEIPQDIKLELNNGTLTLKAGSKVYVPNGFESDGVTPKFDVVIIERDILFSSTAGTSTRQSMWFLVADDATFNSGVFLGERPLAAQQSGTTTPSDTAICYYNVNENLIYFNGTTNARKVCFPLCIITLSNGVLTSIDQVFNGFGYIGSTIFALPGVKGLIPNGRNADGSLKNIEYTTQSVLFYTFEQNWSEKPVVFSISKEESEVRLRPSYYFFEQNTVPSTIPSSQWLNTESNLLYQTYSDTVSWSNAFLRQAFICGSFFITSDAKISNFNHKTAFRALEYNDRETVVGWGIPDYSAGVSITNGTTIVKDGFIAFRTNSIKNTERTVYINGNKLITGAWGSTVDSYIIFCFPVSKNDIITFDSGSKVNFYPMKGVN